MSVATESAGASAVKVTAIATGATLHSMESVTQSFGVNGQNLLWVLTVAYAVLQLVKAIPWITDMGYSFWRGVRHKDWSDWRSISRRGESDTKGAD